MQSTTHVGDNGPVTVTTVMPREHIRRSFSHIALGTPRNTPATSHRVRTESERAHHHDQHYELQSKQGVWDMSDMRFVAFQGSDD